MAPQSMISQPMISQPMISPQPALLQPIAPTAFEAISTRRYSKAALAIDWAQLYQLSDGNQEFEVELIKLFFVETKTLLTNLSEAIGTQNIQRIEHIAHQIKGSSGNIGFRSMSAIADQLELQARQQNLTLAPRFLQELTQWILEIQKFLE